VKRKGLLKLIVGSSLVAVLVISIPLVSGCTAPGPTTTDPIKVGVCSTVTGPLTDDGRHHVRAMEVVRDEINAAGVRKACGTCNNGCWQHDAHRASICS